MAGCGLPSTFEGRDRTLGSSRSRESGLAPYAELTPRCPDPPEVPITGFARRLAETLMMWQEVPEADGEFVREVLATDPELPEAVPAPEPGAEFAERRKLFRPKRPTDLAAAGLNTAQVEGLILKTLLCVG